METTKTSTETKATKHAGQSANAGTRLIKTFNQLTADNVDLVDDLYAETLHFRDPISELHTRNEVKKHLSSQYKNVISCQFEEKSNVHSGHQTTIEWKMTLRHKYLNLGKPIELRGASVLTEDASSKLITHQHDYFDLSAFALKSIPGVQTLYKTLKSMQ